MIARVRSLRQAQHQHAEELRQAGLTWAEIAGIFWGEYKVNARVALRLAHGWSQREAADRWNALWPQDPKSFKNFSYWEQWPSKTGHTPSLDTLSRLAELYSCHIADLVADGPTFNEFDSAYKHRRELEKLPRAVAAAAGEPNTAKSDASEDLADFIKRLHDGDVNELAKLAAEWSKQVDVAIDRRSLLLKLSFALTTAATMSGFDSTEPEVRHSKGETPGLAGIWRSEYGYYSTSRKQQSVGTHYVVIQQAGNALTIESLPQSTGSELRLDVTIDGMFATGTWEERTSPTGYYKGAIYRGAIQLLVSPSLITMAGKWIGFGKNFSINNGDWSFALETRNTAAGKLRSYAGKL